MSTNFLDFVREIYHSKICEKGSILDLTKYKGIAMWWTSDIIFFEKLNTNKKSTEGRNLLKSNLFPLLIIEIYKIIGVFAEFFYDIALKIIIKLLTRMNSLSNFHAHQCNYSNKKIMFISQDRQWGWKSKTDLFFEPLLIELEKEKYELIGIYPIDLHPRRGLKIFIDKLKFGKYRHIAINEFWDSHTWKEEWESQKIFRKNWKLIRENIFNCDYLSLCNNPLKKVILLELSLYFNILYPHLVKYIYIARKMFFYEKPDLIILINETFWWERSLLIAAKMENIPTLAIQHGELFTNDKRHLYTKEEVGSESVFNASFCPLPDKTLVYGEYYRNMFVNLGSYPPQSVVTTGTYKFDQIMTILQSKSVISSKIKKRLEMPDGYKVILWTTQCHGMSDSENINNLSCVLRTINQLKDSILIIKQHPAEPPFYRNLIKKYMAIYNSRVILAPQDIDIISLILTSDIMITKNSTTAIEALLLEKPVVVLNLSGEPDIVNYVKEGVASGVYHEQDLLDAIKDGLVKEKKIQNRKLDYCNDYLDGLHGNAAQKMIIEIKKLLEKN